MNDGNYSNFPVPHEFHDAIERIYQDADGYWADTKGNWVIKSIEFKHTCCLEETLNELYARLRKELYYDPEFRKRRSKPIPAVPHQTKTHRTSLKKVQKANSTSVPKATDSTSGHEVETEQ